MPRRPVDPSIPEAALLAGLRGDLATAIDAVRRGAVEEAVALLSQRHELAVALDTAEEEWQAAAGGPEGPELLAEHLSQLQEAAELAGSPSVLSAAEDLSLLVSSGKADVAAFVLGEAAAPLRKALARQEPEEGGEE